MPLYADRSSPSLPSLTGTQSSFATGARLGCRHQQGSAVAAHISELGHHNESDVNNLDSEGQKCQESAAAVSTTSLLQC